MTNDELRQESGQVILDSKVASFLYELMRDEVPAGKVEAIVRNSEGYNNILACNGYLARYANLLAKRLNT